MSGQTLEQLRAENAAEEKRASKTSQNEDTLPAGDDTVPAGGDTLSGEDSLSAGDDTLEGDQDSQEGGDDTDEGADTTLTTADDWMKPEGEEKLPDVIDNGTAKQIRLKYQGQAKAAKDEAEALRKEIEELKKQKAPVVAAPDKPKRDAYDSEEEYLEAVAAHAVSSHFQRGQTEAQQAQRKARQEQIAAKTEEKVVEHYKQAEAFCAKSKIADTAYKAADLKVRQSVATIFGDSADAVTDSLIARAGPGSEIAMFYLGLPKQRDKLAHFLKLFDDDPTGLESGMYLRELSITLKKPPVRESKAPEPPETIRGDNQKGKGAGGQLRKDYQKAIDNGDIQLAVNLKQKAKAAKLDTQSW
jgi:hypothetical protein